MKRTRLLQNLLIQHESNLTPQEFRNLSDEIDRMIQQAMVTISQLQAGIPRATDIHNYLDRKNIEFSNVTTSCKKGCGACCHLEVEITEDDAERLADAILSQNIPYSEDRLEEQSIRGRLDDAWKQGAIKENRCVLLDDSNSCRAYEARPSACRKHSVVSPVSECETLGAMPVSKIVPLNEIYLSAYFSLPDLKFGSLSKMLKMALNKRKKADQQKDKRAEDDQQLAEKIRSIRNRLIPFDL